MEIKEVRFSPVKSSVRSQERGGEGVTIAYCSVSFSGVIGSFCVRSVRIVRVQDRVIVVMPSSRTHVDCRDCHGVNPSNHHFCMWCGCKVSEKSLAENRQIAKHSDVFHPLDISSRLRLEGAVLQAWDDYERSADRSVSA